MNSGYSLRVDHGTTESLSWPDPIFASELSGIVQPARHGFSAVSSILADTAQISSIRTEGVACTHLGVL